VGIKCARIFRQYFFARLDSYLLAQSRPILVALSISHAESPDQSFRRTVFDALDSASVAVFASPLGRVSQNFCLTRACKNYITSHMRNSWLFADQTFRSNLIKTIGPGERRRLIEAIGRSGLADGLLGTERRTGDDFDEETVGRAIARWERLVSGLGWRVSPLSIEQWIAAKSADRRSVRMVWGTFAGVSQAREGSALISTGP
jgi:hypothetical protein